MKIILGLLPFIILGFVLLIVGNDANIWWLKLIGAIIGTISTSLALAYAMIGEL